MSTQPPRGPATARPAMSDMEVRATSLHAALRHLGHGAHLEQVARTADQFGHYIRTGRMFDTAPEG